MSAPAGTTGFEYHRPAILDEILDHRIKVIEASAGTGKTFTLEHLVVELLRTGVASLDQILVVTFTEKATAELRARIRATVEAMLSASGLAGVERERLKDALFSFHRSPIHTIHSFCHRMLTELAFDSGMRFGIDLASGR
ncbi:MAG: UvrD-helicase domain-containing protein, partial [Candidatus Binatus sp.]